VSVPTIVVVVVVVTSYHGGTAPFSVATASCHESALASGALVAMARKRMYILFFFLEYQLHKNLNG